MPSQRFPSLISSVFQLLCPIPEEVLSWRMAGRGCSDELGLPVSKGERSEELLPKL